MYQILVSSHSGLRWLVLISVLLTTIIAFSKWLGRNEWTEGNRKVALVALILTHIQLLTGLILYFITPRFQFNAASMKLTASRFFMVEHFLLMIIAIILITVGYSVAKRKPFAADKAKWIALTFVIAIILMLAGIPWPFMDLGTGWY